MQNNLEDMLEEYILCKEHAYFKRRGKWYKLKNGEETEMPEFEEHLQSLKDRG